MLHSLLWPAWLRQEGRAKEAQMALDSLRPDDFGSDPFLAFHWHFGRSEVLRDREFFDEARAATAKALVIAEANGMERERMAAAILTS